MSENETDFLKDYFIDHGHLTTLYEWLTFNRGKAFRYWIYRKDCTPYVVDGEIINDDLYEDNFCNTGYLKEAIVLPDNDVLLVFLIEEFPSLQFVKLSEIRMELWQSDQDEQEEEYGDCL